MTTSKEDRSNIGAENREVKNIIRVAYEVRSLPIKLLYSETDDDGNDIITSNKEERFGGNKEVEVGTNVPIVTLPRD